MPRLMPPFDIALSAQAQLAIGIAAAGETVRVAGGPIGREQWTVKRLEALYELAYLRVFAAWEMCLENMLYRSLCGYASGAGQETLVGGVLPAGMAGQYFPTLAAAEAAVLGPAQFKLWHRPTDVINRCRRFIRSGAGFPALQETTIASNVARLEYFAFVRHRIVHDQRDARQKFDVATLAIAGRAYPASRPGKFLRDRDMSGPVPRRWLEVTTSELVSLVAQMV